MRYRKYFKARSDKMRRLVKLRWKRHREEIDRRIAAGEILEREDERPRLDPGELLGVLQWHGCDGKVRRWVVRQGKSRNRLIIDGRESEHGWTWLLDKLRKKLAQLTR